MSFQCTTVWASMSSCTGWHLTLHVQQTENPCGFSEVGKNQAIILTWLSKRFYFFRFALIPNIIEVITSK